MATVQTYESILFERRERVGWITLNRPDRLNAWTYEMNDEMLDAIQSCNDDPGIGAVVVTGAGRGFCAGADVKAFRNAISEREGSADGLATNDRRREEHLAAFLRRSKPLIAAVNGPSIGVGMTMTLPMDIRIASDSAKFSMRFIRMGIVPEVASTMYLPQIVGLQNALDLILTARTIDANEALRMGLVKAVVPGEKLLDETLAFASEIATNPTDQVVIAKQMVHKHMVQPDIDAVVGEENRNIVRAYKGPAHKEAVTAFLEKRQPKFN